MSVRSIDRNAGQATGGTRKTRVVKLSEDEERLLPEKASKLVALKPNVYCDENREYLYDKVTSEGEDGEKIVAYKKRQLQHSGMPRTISVYMVDGPSQRKLDEETFWRIDLSKCDKIAPETFTEAQINTGEWSAKFPGFVLSARRDRDFYADIIKAQVRPFDIPVGKAKRETGFHQDALSHMWSYFLRDGRILSQNELTDPHIPIAGYDFPADHARAWQAMTALPEPPENAARLFSWLASCDAHNGRPALLCFAAYRSLICSFLPTETAILAVAADDLDGRDGSAGSGKTTTIDFARGVDGPCPYKTKPETPFRGSPAGIEGRIKGVHDLLISIGDFHMTQETPAESELIKWADKTDTFIAGAADNTPMRPRANKDGTPRPDATIGGFLVLDGEKLHPLILSRLRRVAILAYRRHEIDTESIHKDDNWTKYQAIHTSVGYAILRRVLTSVNQNETEFTRRMRDREQEYTQKLLTHFRQKHAGFDEQIARSLASNFARFMTGAYLAEITTDARGLVSQAFTWCSTHMEAQARLLENGGPSTVSREWILKTTRLLLEECQAHTLDMDNKELEDDRPDIRYWGYKRGFDNHMAPQGPHLLNLSEDSEMTYFKPALWQDKLKVQAKREGIKWTYTNQTFPAALVRMGIVEPEPGQGGKSARHKSIAGKSERRLWIPARLLDIDNQEEETPPGPPEGQGQEHPTTEGQARSTEGSGPPAAALSTEGQGQEHTTEGSGPGAAALTTTEPPPIDGHASARALLNEMGARGYSLELNHETNGWKINVPYDWTEEEFHTFGQRAVTLTSELHQLLDHQEHTTEGNGPAAAALSTEGQGQEHTTEGSGPAAAALTTTEPGQATAQKKWTGGVKRQYREIPTAFVDVNSGLAVCGEETHQVGPHPPLSAILAALPSQIERIYLTGGRPGDGDVDGLYTWLREPVIGGGWQAGKLHIDADLPVLSLTSTTTKQKVDIRRVAAWFGEGSYTPYQARLALSTLDRLLQDTFDSKARCLTTPGSTGLDLWDRSRVCDYPVLSQEYQALLEDTTPYQARAIRDVIKNTSGQGRIELCPVPGRETLPGFTYLDGRFMYAALGQGLGFGPAEHDRVSTFEPLRRGRYFIRFTVPPDWQHVGIFAVKREDSRGGWFYPGQEHAGQTFETWADATEIRLALKPPHSMTPWYIEVRERLLLQSATAGQPWPLDVWCNKLIALRQAIANAQDIPEEIRPLLLAAARSMLLHGVGSFARSMRDELVIVSPQNTADLARLPAEYEPVSHDDGTWSYTRPAKLSPWSQRMMHPEFPAAIWARCRTHLLYSAKKQGRGQIVSETGAFLMPRKWLVGFRTDAVYGTSDPNWPDDGVTPGQFRVKGQIDAACPQPGIPGQATTEKDYRLLNTLRDKSETALKDHKA